MSDEPEYRDPYLEYTYTVLAQVAGLPRESGWAFDLACLEREVVIYQKIARLCGCEHLLDFPGILADLWGWLLDGKAVPPHYLEIVEAVVPYPTGPDFYGFRLDILGNLLSAIGRSLSGYAYDDLIGITAERNINIIRRFISVAYDLRDEGVEVNPQVLNHPLLLREVEKQQEDLKLLYESSGYTREVGEWMRQRSVGYDLFNGAWFPDAKIAWWFRPGASRQGPSC
jgi:hypothetical protein